MWKGEWLEGLSRKQSDTNCQEKGIESDQIGSLLPWLTPFGFQVEESIWRKWKLTTRVLWVCLLSLSLHFLDSVSFDHYSLSVNCSRHGSDHDVYHKLSWSLLSLIPWYSENSERERILWRFVWYLLLASSHSFHTTDNMMEKMEIICRGVMRENEKKKDSSSDLEEREREKVEDGWKRSSVQGFLHHLVKWILRLHSWSCENGEAVKVAFCFPRLSSPWNIFWYFVGEIYGFQLFVTVGIETVDTNGNGFKHAFQPDYLVCPFTLKHPSQLVLSLWECLSLGLSFKSIPHLSCYFP